jgi:hypothetical protein
VRPFLGARLALEVAKLAFQSLEKRHMNVAIQLDEVSQQQQAPPQAFLQSQGG